MAITIHDKPLDDTLGTHPLNGIVPLVLSSDNIAEPKFRYLITLKVQGSEITTLRILPNAQGRVVIDLRRMFQDQVGVDIVNPDAPGNSSDNPITYPFPAAELVKENTEYFKSFSIECGESYAATASDPATDYPNLQTVNFKGAPIKHQAYEGLPVSPTAGLLFGTNSECLVEEYETDPIDNAILVEIGNDESYILPYFAWFPTAIPLALQFFAKIDIYYEATAPYSITLDLSAVGGTDPSNGLPDNQGVQYLLCGPSQLSNNTLIPGVNQPSSATDWTHYDVQFLASNGTTPVSKKYRFRRVCRHPRHSTFQLLYQNKYGTWNFLAFEYKSKRQLEVSRKHQRNVRGSYNGTSFSTPSFAADKKHYRGDARWILELESRHLTDGQFEAVENYIDSGCLYIIDVNQRIVVANVRAMPVVLRDKSFIQRTKRSDRNKTLKISVELALPRRTT